MAAKWSIYIIYNPNSTGDSVAMAEAAAAELKKTHHKVTLTPTKHAGHAEELAYEFACGSPRPLIISASGDGGYHEVVNGIMRANHDGHPAIAGLLPAGNANDHFHSLHSEDFYKLVGGQQFQVIDVLKLSGNRQGQPYTRYAHSYIGFGLTPRIGRELTRTELNRVKETWISLRTLLTYKAVSLRVDGHIQRYQSLTCSNIDRMAKVLTLSPQASVTDGKFEVNALHYRSKLMLIASLLKGAIGRMNPVSSVSSLDLKTVKRTLVQLDGETVTLDANSDVKITAERQALECVV